MKFRKEKNGFSIVWLCVVLILAGGMLSSSAFAWPVVNGFAICTARYDQSSPQLVADGQGGAIITWRDDRSGSSNPDIYAQRVALVLNTTGGNAFLQETTLWTLGGVAVCTAGNNQYNPQVEADGEGGAIITWQDYRSGTDWHIYAQRVDAAGTVKWTLDGVAICTAGNIRFYPQVEADGEGGAIITWMDGWSGTDYDIYAQRVDAAGTVKWTLGGVAVCTAANDQVYPQVVADGQGGAIITWQDYRSGYCDIYAQRVDAAGTVKWTLDGVAICTAGNDQYNTQVEADGEGGAIITWQDYRSTTGNPGQGADIYAQRVDASGNIASGWPVNGVAVCTTGNNQVSPQLVADGQGGAIITWHDWADIYAQRVDAAGNIASGWPVNGVAVCTAGNAQYNTQVEADGEGGAIITWQDYRSTTGNPGQGADIYAQRVDASGNIASGWPVNGVAVCTAGIEQSSPQLVADGQGGAIITWMDFRSGTYYDIYAQQIDFAGTTTTHYYWPETNGNVSICTAGNEQSSPQVVADGQGGAIITWNDNRIYSNWDIYAQRVDAAGTPLWAVNGFAICTAGNIQQSPQVVADGQGGAIITWMDYRSGTYWDIYAQRVDAAGTVKWTLNGVAICTAGNEQLYPQVVADGQGGALITWYDYRSGTYYDIYAQRVDASGTVKWTLGGVAICTAANDQVYPQVVADGEGGAIITWNDSRSGNYDIYAQRVDAAGTRLWTLNGVAICTAVNSQQSPQLVADGQGGAIITWGDGRSGSYDIYAQRVDAAGNIASGWPVNGVAICTAGNNQLYPQVVADGEGGAIITWDDYRNGNRDIYAQRVDAAGTRLWTLNGFAICIAGYDQSSLQLVADGGGGAIITWQDYRSTTGNPGQGADIYAQRVDAAGTRLWTLNGFAVCTAGNDQTAPQLESDGEGGAIITWQDHRSGTFLSFWDIYAQRIYASGWMGAPRYIVPVAVPPRLWFLLE